jgi:acyl-CoA synthetase (AMP-forming)/AMP-acid ligase II/acyl carrier protein
MDLLRRRAAEQPDQTAFIFLRDGEAEERRIDYAELDRLARRIAAALQDRCQPGDRALLLYPPGMDFVAGFMGCLYAGVIAVPAFPPHSARHERNMTRLRAIAANAQPSALLTVARQAENIRAANLESCRHLCTDELADNSETRWREPSISPDTIACLQYTSGSTATPRGVVLTHGNLMHNSATIAAAFEHSASSIGVNWLPPYHDMGLIGGVLQPMYVGFLHIMMAPTAFLQKPLRWLRAISTYRGTTCGGPDFAYELCLRSITEEERATLDLSSWDVAFNGAEPIRADVLDRFAEKFAPCGFRKQAFFPCYGLAEATLMVTGGAKSAQPITRSVDDNALRAHRVETRASDAEHAKTIVGCGHARSDHQVLIVNPETREPCQANGIGEVWVSGGAVSQGYWSESAETQAVFGARLAHDDSRSFLRTGDLGYLASDGELFITGRLKDLIIIRGTNHYPHDIEQTVREAHPALQGCCGAAFAVTHEQQERLVIAYEVQRTHRNANPDEIFAAIRQRVAEKHELQTHAILLLKPGQILRTSSGKIQRNPCRQAFLSKEFEHLAMWVSSNGACHAEPSPILKHVSAAVDAATSPLAHVRTWLAAHLAAATNTTIDQIDTAEPFARYGLDSASAVSLASVVAERAGVSLEATLFWDYPSIDLLAEYLVSECGVTGLTSPDGSQSMAA